jgi:hypothetical protein
MRAALDICVLWHENMRDCQILLKQQHVLRALWYDTTQHIARISMVIYNKYACRFHVFNMTWCHLPIQTVLKKTPLENINANISADFSCKHNLT